MTTQQRALELTDWIGNNDIHKMDPNLLLAIVKSFLMMEHLTTLKEAGNVARNFSTGLAADARLQALAEERSVG
jgi:hypothetical protein